MFPDWSDNSLISNDLTTFGFRFHKTEVIPIFQELEVIVQNLFSHTALSQSHITAATLLANIPYQSIK